MNILPLSQVTDKDLQQVGYKALRLGQLLMEKFPVPTGYIITESARQDFFASANLVHLIDSEMSKIDLVDPHSVDHASKLITDAILSAPMPQELEIEILQQFTHINSEKVAVRASTYSKDTYSKNWREAIVSYLDVDASDLVEKIKKVWASLYSAHSLYFLVQKSIKVNDVSLGVVVERMIPLTFNGVIYTEHPINRDSNQMVIEEMPCNDKEKKVQDCRPRVYTIDKKAKELIEAANIDNNKEKPVLKNTLLMDLIDLALKLENKFAHPIEIEWGYGSEGFVVFQADPVTRE